MPADSPENKCPGDFIGDDLSGVHTCHAGCPCHSSGGGCVSNKAAQGDDPARPDGPPPVDPQCPSRSPQVPDRDVVCPECGKPDPVLIDGGFEMACGNHWHKTCAFPGSHEMRIERESEGPDSASPPSPDRETGELVIEEHVPCEGDCEFCKETARAGDDYQYEFGSTAESVAWLNGSLDASSGVFKWVPNSVEATASPSAAPTNQESVARTDGEGEGPRCREHGHGPDEDGQCFQCGDQLVPYPYPPDLSAGEGEGLEVTRYRTDSDGQIWPDPEGQLVSYSDWRRGEKKVLELRTTLHRVSVFVARMEARQERLADLARDTADKLDRSKPGSSDMFNALTQEVSWRRTFSRDLEQVQRVISGYSPDEVEE